MTPDQQTALRKGIAANEQLHKLATAANDVGLLAALSSETEDGNIFVPAVAIKKAAILSGYYAAIVLLSRRVPQTQDEGLVVGAAISAVGYCEDQRPEFALINLSLSSTQAMVAGLVAGGAMTQDQANTVLAMGNGKISLATKILADAGLPDVTDLTIQDMTGLR